MCTEKSSKKFEKVEYRVKDEYEYIKRFYGSADPDLIEEYQTNGIPADELEFLTGEWGDLSEMLEEI